MDAALSGLKVLDLTRVLAGPWCTQLLADLGAEVIKIEHPVRGDDTRAWGPPWWEGSEGRESAYFLSANRGKRSVALDIARPEGAALVRDLAARADVLIENFKVGGLASYGLDYASLSAIHPGLVYCSITGFGQDGPYRDRPGYDSIVQAMGGMMSVTGEPAGAPMKAGVAIADVFTGLYAANAVQAALRQRDRTGRGQHIDVALLDVQVAVMANIALNHLVSGQDPPRHGNAHASIVPYQAFATADRPIAVAVGNDQQFVRFAAVLGAPELAADPAFATNEARVLNRAVLVPRLQALLQDRRSLDVLEAFATGGVPAGPINTMDEVFQDPQVVHRSLAITTPHALGPAPGVAQPFRMAGGQVASPHPPPRLGADTREVLKGTLNLSDAAVDDLAARGIVRTA